MSDPNKGMYNLEYYLNYVRELKELGIHVLAIKDMAGLLKPESAKMLVEAIRAEHFDLPIHGKLNFTSHVFFLYKIIGKISFSKSQI